MIGWLTWFIVVRTTCHSILVPNLQPSTGFSVQFEEIDSINADSKGLPMAFADLDADRYTDIILLMKDKQRLDVLLMGKDKAQRQVLIESPNKSKKIQSVMIADFDGDSLPDIFVCLSKSSSSKECEVIIIFGKNKHLNFGEVITVAEFTSQPLALDWNADMRVDLYGDVKNGKRVVYLAGANQKFTKVDIETDSTVLPMANHGLAAFINVIGDLQPDIIITASNGNKRVFQLISKDSEKYVHKAVKNIDLPAGVLFGAPCFGDFSLKGSIDMIVPSCLDANCTSSVLQIYLFTSNKWLKATIKSSVSFSFIPSHLHPLSKEVQTSELPGFTAADVNLDSLVDLVTMVKVQNGIKAAILVNNGDNIFTLVLQESVKKPVLVSVFDYKEDGNIELLTSSENGYNVKLYKSILATDYPYFLKVMVLNCFCNFDKCPDGRLPYGVITPGALTYFITDDVIAGIKRERVGSASPSSSYMSLPLPFVTFGLGLISNYLETVKVTLPYTAKVFNQREIKFIVPNTQLVVVPYPYDNPAKWSVRLFLHPFYNTKVMWIGIGLLLTFFVISVVASLLQLTEYLQDRKEMQQDAHKFNFAM